MRQIDSLKHQQTEEEKEKAEGLRNRFFKFKHIPSDMYIRCLTSSDKMFKSRKCLDIIGSIFVMDRYPTERDIKDIISNLVDWDNIIIYARFPHRIHKKDVDEIEIIEQ